MSNTIETIQTFLGLYPTSRNHFHLKIKNVYDKISDRRISEDLLKTLICEVTEEQYDCYRRFWNKYPKSKKRYSNFKIEDLNHPSIHDLIIKFFKEKTPANYVVNCMIMLEMEEVSFLAYEKSRQEFYDMF